VTDRLKIWLMAGLTPALVVPHSLAYAQASGCVAMEAMTEDQEAFTSESPPVADAQHKGKRSKPSAQHRDDRGTTYPREKGHLPQVRIYQSIAL
jgi:hypothetical protein